MTDKEMTAMVTAAMGSMPTPRRVLLETFLVHPRHEERASDYKNWVGECWVIAAKGETVIVYCKGGLVGGEGSDPWGFLPASGRSLGSDDCWYPSLDDVFMCSGLCPRNLIPSDYEAP